MDAIWARFVPITRGPWPKDWDEKPVTSKQLNDWIAGYRGYRTG